MLTILTLLRHMTTALKFFFGSLCVISFTIVVTVGQEHNPCVLLVNVDREYAGWTGTLKLSGNCSLSDNKRAVGKIFTPDGLIKEKSAILNLQFHNFVPIWQDEKNCCDSIEIINTIVDGATSIDRRNETTFDTELNLPMAVNEIGFVTIAYFNNGTKMPKEGFSIKYTFTQYVDEYCKNATCVAIKTKTCNRQSEMFTCDSKETCPCKYNGTCSTNINKGHQYNCTCSENLTGERCQTELSCSSSICQNGGICMGKDGTCSCPSNYWGQYCEHKNDGTFCAPGQDQYPGSKITWKETKMGSNDSQPCPGANGTAVRRCLINDTAIKNNPVWSQPDLSLCVTPELNNIASDISLLLKEQNVKSNDIVNITTRIYDALTSTNNTTIYAGDLSIATDTARHIAALIKKVNGSDLELLHIAQGYGHVISRIIDPSTSDIWRFTQDGYIENKVTSLLCSMEQFSTNIAEKTSVLQLARKHRDVYQENRSMREEIAVNVTNLAFSVQIMHRSSIIGYHTYTVDANNNSITLPEEVFNKAASTTKEQFIHLYSARFSSLSQLLADTNAKIEQQTNPSMAKTVISDIFASRVLNVPEDVFQDLSQRVKIMFTTQFPSSSSHLEQKCVFLNMTSRDREHRWLQSGCVRSFSESNSSYTVCYCNHLTNFAVLLDVYGVQETIDELDSKILMYISYGGGTLSIVGCLLAVIVFEFFRLNSERVRIHEQLALTIIFVQLFFQIGIDRTENQYVCMTMAICLHYVLVAMFCWMLVEGIHLYVVLVKVFRSHSNMKKYITIGWGVPLVIVGISSGVFHAQYGSSTTCWLTRKVLLVAFVPPVGLVIMINMAILVIVTRIMLKSMVTGSKVSAEQERSSIKTTLKATIVLLPLLGLTWTFGFLSVTSKETLVFTYLFTFFNSLQGVFFFVFHCLLSVDVQNAYERHNRRKNQMRLTESFFSKKGTLRTDSDYSSSISGSRSSVKTDSISTLNRPRTYSNSNSAYQTESQHNYVPTDDDRLCEQNINPHPFVQNPYTDQSSHADMKSCSNDNAPNNVVRRSSRHGSEKSGDYVLYYGKNISNHSNTYSP